jgi:hypothetical protein
MDGDLHELDVGDRSAEEFCVFIKVNRKGFARWDGFTTCGLVFVCLLKFAY